MIRGLGRGGADASDRVGDRRAAVDAERRGRGRLAWVHATSGFGDALVAVALAGTLFFSVPVAAARPRVALYLLITVAPFAVVALLLFPLAFGLLVFSRVHGISRSALVPELVGPGRDLVPINSRMARVIA